MKRLHAKLTSVEEGDNREILIYKAAPEPKPRAQRLGTRPKKQARPDDLEALFERQERGLSAVDKAAKTVGDTVERMTRTNRKANTVAVETYADVIAEVDRRAVTVQTEAKDAGDPISMAKAKAQVWHDDPELVQRSRNAPKSDHPAPPVDQGLSAEIAAAVHARALEASGRPEMWTKTIPEMRNAIRHTPDGKLLTALERAAAKRDPETLAKFATHKRAFAVLRQWQENPADGVADY